MRIQNNLMALNTHRMLGLNNSNGMKSMEKLSSGYRINKAGDDAAGLAISEKMRGQIRGLNQASKNAQDGISMIQTAEGALNETHEILQRMRELSVQAANDTNVSVDRDAIQNEVNQLTLEVDRIANNTEFNTQKLLNGSSSIESDEDLIVSNLKKYWLAEAESLVFESYGLQASNVTMEVEIFNDPSHPAAALVRASFTSAPGNTTGTPDITGQGGNLRLEINLAHADPVEGSTDGGSYPQYVDRVIAHEIAHATMMTTMNFGDLPIWYTEGTAEFVHGADERLKNNIYLEGGSNLGNLDAGVAAVVASIGSGDYADWNGTSSDYSAAFLAVRYLDEQIKSTGASAGSASDSEGIKLVMDYLSTNPTDNLDDALADLQGSNLIGFSNTADWITALKADVIDQASLAAKTGIILDFSVVGSQFAPEVDTGSVLGSDATGVIANAKTAEEVLPQTAGSGATELLQPMSGFNIVWPEGYDQAGGAKKLQIGANYDQSIDINFGDMRSAALGILDDQSAIQLNSFESATAAIEVYNTAIERVSSERSKLGSYQNRLEYAIKNIDTSAENLQASESRIRDIDMAKEMMEFTKNNILQQAAQAMLSQANQAPQGVLQLLR